MFKHREEYLRNKYQLQNANQESNNNSLNVANDKNQTMTQQELQKATHEEIFKTMSNFKKPLNFINYSHTDYDLINNLPSSRHLQPFMDMKVDYQTQLKDMKT